MREIEFTKMHGAGNDYIYLDAMNDSFDDIPGLATRISDRHFGVGSDGLVLIRPSEDADCFMDMYNSDGSRAEMCGNAIRCVAKYVYERGIVGKRSMLIETLAGMMKLDLIIEGDDVTGATVDMGEPILRPADIPVMAEGETAIGIDLAVGGTTYKATCVSMGNPHAVIFVDAMDDDLVHVTGRQIELLPLFPNKTNVEFVKVLGRDRLRMRVWERGSGETLACGTGACATLVAAVLNGHSDRKATVELLGGNLEIEWRQENNRVFMTGPAVEVFSGVYRDPQIK